MHRKLDSKIILIFQTDCLYNEFGFQWIPRILNKISDYIYQHLFGLSVFPSVRTNLFGILAFPSVQLNSFGIFVFPPMQLKSGIIQIIFNVIWISDVIVAQSFQPTQRNAFALLSSTVFRCNKLRMFKHAAILNYAQIFAFTPFIPFNMAIIVINWIWNGFHWNVFAREPTLRISKWSVIRFDNHSQCSTAFKSAQFHLSHSVWRRAYKHPKNNKLIASKHQFISISAIYQILWWRFSLFCLRCCRFLGSCSST